MGIKSSIKKVIGKGAMKVSKTKVGKKIMDKAMEKELKKMPEAQREQATNVMEQQQNMSVKEQEEIAEKMKESECWRNDGNNEENDSGAKNRI